VARPRSEDKRNAILNAATRVFAERGLTAAPTSEISKEAGVAEGTLFTYFRTKDDLMNSLYQEIKLEVADAMMSGAFRRAIKIPRRRKPNRPWISTESVCERNGSWNQIWWHVGSFSALEQFQTGCGALNNQPRHLELSALPNGGQPGGQD
jgi:AcrR family transcriptional regulator